MTGVLLEEVIYRIPHGVDDAVCVFEEADRGFGRGDGGVSSLLMDGEHSPLDEVDAEFLDREKRMLNARKKGFED